MLIAVCLIWAIVLFLILYIVINNLNSNSQAVQERLATLQGEGGRKRAVNKPQQSLFIRLFQPLLAGISNLLRVLAPKTLYQALEKDIEASGNFQGRGMSGFLMYCMGLPIAFILLVFFYISSRPASAQIGAGQSILMFLLGNRVDLNNLRAGGNLFNLKRGIDTGIRICGNEIYEWPDKKKKYALDCYTKYVNFIQNAQDEEEMVSISDRVLTDWGIEMELFGFQLPVLVRRISMGLISLAQKNNVYTNLIRLVLNLFSELQLF